MPSRDSSSTCISRDKSERLEPLECRASVTQNVDTNVRESESSNSSAESEVTNNTNPVLRCSTRIHKPVERLDL